MNKNLAYGLGFIINLLVATTLYGIAYSIGVEAKFDYNTFTDGIGSLYGGVSSIGDMVVGIIVVVGVILVIKFTADRNTAVAAALAGLAFVLAAVLTDKWYDGPTDNFWMLAILLVAVALWTAVIVGLGWLAYRHYLRKTFNRSMQHSDALGDRAHSIRNTQGTDHTQTLHDPDAPAPAQTTA